MHRSLVKPPSRDKPIPIICSPCWNRRLSQRDVNRRRRLLQQAKFPIAYTLESYDFSVVPSLSKQKVLELARGEFIRKAENVVLVGEIGTGKTHLASALGLCRL